jgi:hypothetical protein
MNAIHTPPRTSAPCRAALAVVIALALLASAGCGPAPHNQGDPAKASFVLAADRICAEHFETVMSWIEQPRAGDAWQQVAVENEGLYQIIAHTVRRLTLLRRPPDPNGEVFLGYVKTLKARAVLFRLMSMADLKRDTEFALRLQRRVGEIDSIGDRDAHQYGLRICGTSARDLGQAFADAGWAGR